MIPITKGWILKIRYPNNSNKVKKANIKKANVKKSSVNEKSLSLR